MFIAWIVNSMNGLTPRESWDCWLKLLEYLFFDAITLSHSQEFFGGRRFFTKSLTDMSIKRAIWFEVFVHIYTNNVIVLRNTSLT